MNISKIQRIQIDSNCNLHYAAFYVLGLQKIFHNKVKFSHFPFKNLKEGRKNCLLLIAQFENKEIKIAIDFHDPNIIDEKVIEWCDVYAKINFHHKQTIDDLKRIFKTEKEFVTNKNKITIIPPSFGINIFNYYDLFKFLGNIILTKDLNKEDKKTLY